MGKGEGGALDRIFGKTRWFYFLLFFSSFLPMSFAKNIPRVQSLAELLFFFAIFLCDPVSPFPCAIDQSYERILSFFFPFIICGRVLATVTQGVEAADATGLQVQCTAARCSAAAPRRAGSVLKVCIA